jgi:hypothetical protein
VLGITKRTAKCICKGTPTVNINRVGKSIFQKATRGRQKGFIVDPVHFFAFDDLIKILYNYSGAYLIIELLKMYSCFFYKVICLPTDD